MALIQPDRRVRPRLLDDVPPPVDLQMEGVRAGVVPTRFNELSDGVQVDARFLLSLAALTVFPQIPKDFVRVEIRAGIGRRRIRRLSVRLARIVDRRGNSNDDEQQEHDTTDPAKPGPFHAAAALSNADDLGLVTGWRSEIDPEASIYNAMCDYEWHRPAGDIPACGGDMMVRAEAFERIDGFNPEVIAAEDDEFCTRLRKDGWRLHRLPIPMTHHDANMMTFGQWWSRAVRTGHGFEQVNDLHSDYFVRERMRMWLYGAVLPFAALFGAVLYWPLLAAIVVLYGVSYVRSVRGLEKSGLERTSALRQSVYLFLSKFPNVIGASKYRKRKRSGAEMEIIEYKWA